MYKKTFNLAEDGFPKSSPKSSFSQHKLNCCTWTSHMVEFSDARREEYKYFLKIIPFSEKINQTFSTQNFSFSSTVSAFPQLSQIFLNFLSFSSTFSVFPQLSHFSSTFSVFPQLSQFILNFLIFLQLSQFFLNFLGFS